MPYDPSQIRGTVAVAGAVDLVSPTGELGQGSTVLHAKMIKAALDDAGLSLNDLDGIASAGGFMGSMEVAEYIGVQPSWTDSTQIGGSSFEAHVEHAFAAIASGHADVIAVVHAQTPRTDRKRGGGGRGRPRGGFGGPNPMMDWEMPYGLRMPIGGYALAASRHMGVYGTTSEQLAQIAVSTREWASRNPNAYHQKPITIQDVLDSEPICLPLRKLDCCLSTDGAGCVVLVRADRAKDLAKPPVYVLGAATGHTHQMISQMPDLTVTAGAVTGPKAFKGAQITNDDVDVLCTYDSFTITVLLALEDLGFCAKGEGGAFVEDGKLGPGGSLPTNTNGGGLSYTHPGMYGMFLLVEAVRQLRGESTGQVDGAKVAIAHGCGGVLSSTSTVVFGSEEAL